MTKNETKKNKKEKSTNSEKVKLLVLIFAVMTPFLYMFGYYYTNGYLLEFGLNNEYFLREFDYYLIKGYESIILIIQDYIIGIIEHYMAIVWLMLFIGFSSLAIFLFAFFEERIEIFQQKSRIWFDKNKYIDKFIITFFLPIITGIGLFLVPLLIIMMLYIPYIGGFYQGKEQAKKDKKEFVNCIVSEMSTIQKCIEIKNGNQSIRGIFIAKTPDAIALWTTEGLQVIENKVLIKVIHGVKSIN